MKSLCSVYPDLCGLGRAVLFNCHRSDAKYWGNLSLCNMLARLRSLYLHEQGLPPYASPVQSEVLAWIDERESLWETLEDSDYEKLPPENSDPFDSDSVNDLLISRGLLYGAGLGMFQKPQFFLADLKKTEVKNLGGENVTLHYAGREYIHDMLPSAAARSGHTILIRTEIFNGFLHYKFHEAMYLRKDHPLSLFFTSLGIHPSEGYSRKSSDAGENTAAMKISQLSEDLIPVITGHEEGEFLAAKVMGDYAEEWSRRVCEAAGNKIRELTLRGYKDLLADSVEGGTLDQLIKSRNETGMLFYAAVRDSFQKSLDPQFHDELRSVTSGRFFPGSDQWKELDGIRERLQDRSLLLLRKHLNNQA